MRSPSDDQKQAVFRKSSIAQEPLPRRRAAAVSSIAENKHGLSDTPCAWSRTWSPFLQPSTTHRSRSIANDSPLRLEHYNAVFCIKRCEDRGRRSQLRSKSYPRHRSVFRQKRNRDSNFSTSRTCCQAPSSECGRDSDIRDGFFSSSSSCFSVFPTVKAPSPSCRLPTLSVRRKEQFTS